MEIRIVLVAVSALFLCACVNGQTTDEYAVIARLDNCGQSCNGSCEATDGVCRCDSECERYGDCCAGKVACDGGEQRAQLLAGLQCRSIHLNPSTQPDKAEAFWMVSACPEDWLTEQEDEELRGADEKCRNGSDSLPPVTDLDSGVVYKNEYCAICHRVENIRPWGYRFGCTSWLNSMIRTEGFTLTREIIQRECIACGFRAPQTEPPPRTCLHGSLVTEECLVREQLEERTGLRWEEEEYQDVVTRCGTSPTSPVILRENTSGSRDYPGSRPYRNQYCAICNGERTAELSCADPYDSRDTTDFCLVEAEDRDVDRPTSPTPPPTTQPTTLATATTNPPNGETFKIGEDNIVVGRPGINLEASPDGNLELPPEDSEPVPPFSIFLDINGDSQVITSETVSVNITTSCHKGEVFDPVEQSCRPTICPEGFATQRGSCAIVQNITVICDGEFIVLDEDEFTLIDNRTLKFRGDVYEIFDYNDSLPIICSNYSQNGTFLQNVTRFYYSYPPASSILTYVGCSLSVIGCVVVLFTYSLFKELRSLPGQILMNLTSAILATCLFLLVGIPIISLAEKDELCEATAILLHWLMLSQFSWMSIMSFELARTLFRASRLRQVEHNSIKKKIFLLYFLIGWGIPTAITIISVIVNYTTDLIGYGEDGFCWISHIHSFYTVFVAPVVLSIIFNGITFTVTVSLLFKASRAQAKLNKQQSISYFRVYLSVFSITGLTWVFGFIAIVVRDDWAWYTFIVLTSTQGFVICLAFILTQKVGSLYKGFFTPSVSEKTSSKSNAKQRTQESSLPVKYVRKSENDSTASALAQEDAKPTERATRYARKENGDQVSIEMDNIQRPTDRDQNDGN